MNQLNIIGNLTGDPESRQLQTQSGMADVCNFTVAVNWKRGGKDMTGFFRVTCWGKTAENCQKYLAKGRKARVTGPVSVRTWTGQDGKTRVSMEVDAAEVEFLGGRGADGQPETEERERPPIAEETTPVTDDELPF